ncbi:PAS domain S-box protein [Pseudodesulfovibrio cashew]|uniref:histidine kinase n=1 Tax=Pseudodesulfovibrio cashew TaxID=2678688 RepID=A0A6I6JJ12_9BACT|nr:ATP-binding protein [Pseudodesulfovibrio cashew]QGY40373.1 PAS domain S-box protein [Pseudodesulfovibrio cashew]
MNLQNYYETVMELSHGIVVALDLNGGIIHGNSELVAMSGYTIEELAGRDWFETFIPKGERRMARRAILKKARGKDVSAFAGVIRAKDGDTVYVNWNLKPLTDSNGDPVSLLCVGQDVTDLILREKALLRERANLVERNKQLHCLYAVSLLMGDVDMSPDSVLDRIVDLLPSAFRNPASTHARLALDRKTRETPGYEPSETVLSERIMVNREKRGRLSVAVKHDAPGLAGEPFTEGERGLFATVARQVAIVVSKKEMREAKQELERQLRQADRLAKIGQFSAGVAHEINEPLANILGFAELARQADGLPDQVKADLGAIIDSSLHAREIVRKLMFFSRKLPPQLMPLDLNETVEQALRITESQAKRGNIEIVRDYASPAPRVTADPQHLKQVVVNLVANAIQAMERDGTVRVTTSSVQDDAYLIVEDTGPGMAPEVVKHIFTPFFTTKDVDQGTGLGLSVVHGIVKAHGGFIQVDSTPGEGVRVEVVFPSPGTRKEGAA